MIVKGWTLCFNIYHRIEQHFWGIRRFNVQLTSNHSSTRTLWTRISGCRKRSNDILGLHSNMLKNSRKNRERRHFDILSKIIIYIYINIIANFLPSQPSVKSIRDSHAVLFAIKHRWVALLCFYTVSYIIHKL